MVDIYLGDFDPYLLYLPFEKVLDAANQYLIGVISHNSRIHNYGGDLLAIQIVHAFKLKVKQ